MWLDSYYKSKDDEESTLPIAIYIYYNIHTNGHTSCITFIHHLLCRELSAFAVRARMQHRIA